MARAADTPTPTFGPASTLSDQSASVVMSTPRLGGCMSKRPPGGRKEPRMAATTRRARGGCPELAPHVSRHVEQFTFISGLSV